MSTTETRVAIKPSALVVLFENFEEIEAVSTIDVLRRGGVDVKTFAFNGQSIVTGAHGISMAADLLQFPPKAPDMVIIPGGAGIFKLRGNHFLQEILHDQYIHGRWIAAICAAPIILADMGILENHRYTAHASMRDELPEARTYESVITDGNIVTAAGPSTAITFGLTLLSLLTTTENSKTIAKQMMYE